MNTFKKLSSTSAAAALLIGATSFSPTDAFADQQILDDLIVQGSICVGFDCVNGESFGFDTLRLKENNLRIHFQDTSTSASFPTNDWRILINETSNGGANFFAVQDSDTSRNLFTIEAGAPSNSLFVEDSGDIGLGTNNPVADMHIVSGNTPTVRLEQNGTNGFTPQTWDLAGNEANFFIRDATNGSTLPIRLRPGAPTSAIDIAGSGDIGFGTSSPDAALHVARNSSSFQFLSHLENTGTGGIAYRMTSNGLSIDTNNTAGVYRINFADGDNQELELDGDGNLIIDGELTTSGSCSVGCDRVFDADYDMPTISEHAEYMFVNRHLPAVGPTVEGQPMNLTRKVEGILNELEKAHIYISQLEDRLKIIEASRR